MDRDGFAWPSQPTLAKAARVSDRTVRRHIEQAVALGWLSVDLAGHTGQGWRRHAYRCAIPDQLAVDDKDEELADVYSSKLGDVDPIEGADMMVSSPSAERADITVSSPSLQHAETCGHPAQEGADISSEGADAGDQNVRTQLCPTISSSELLNLNSHRSEAQLAQRARDFVDVGMSEESRRARQQARTLAERIRMEETGT
jgi:Helix-turn-helix domain